MRAAAAAGPRSSPARGGVGHAVVEVHQAAILSSSGRGSARTPPSASSRSPNSLISTGFGLPGEVVDQVGEELHELDLHARHRAVRSRARTSSMTAKMSAARSTRGFRRTTMSPRVLLGGEEPHLRPRAPRRGRRSRAGRQDLLDDPQLPVGLRQRRAGGREVVEHEGALVDHGQEARAHEAVEDQPPATTSSTASAASAPRVAEHLVEARAVRIGEPVDARVHAAPSSAAQAALPPAAGAPSSPSPPPRLARTNWSARSGTSVRASTSETSTATASVSGERHEELAHHALEQPEREEDHHGGEGGGGHGPDQLRHRVAHGRRAARAAAPGGARCSP